MNDVESHPSDGTSPFIYLLLIAAIVISVIIAAPGVVSIIFG